MWKWKVTYIDGSSGIKAKIIKSDFYNLGISCSSNGVYDSDIVKIEKVFDAEDENIEDTTKD